MEIEQKLFDVRLKLGLEKKIHVKVPLGTEVTKDNLAQATELANKMANDPRFRRLARAINTEPFSKWTEAVLKFQEYASETYGNDTMPYFVMARIKAQDAVDEYYRSKHNI